MNVELETVLGACELHGFNRNYQWVCTLIFQIWKNVYWNTWTKYLHEIFVCCNQLAILPITSWRNRVSESRSTSVQWLPGLCCLYLNIKNSVIWNVNCNVWLLYLTEKSSLSLVELVQYFVSHKNKHNGLKHKSLLSMKIKSVMSDRSFSGLIHDLRVIYFMKNYDLKK